MVNKWQEACACAVHVDVHVQTRTMMLRVMFIHLHVSPVEHDVGANSFAILRIRRAFHYAYQHLTTCAATVVQQQTQMTPAKEANNRVRIDEEGNRVEQEKKVSVIVRVI